MPTRHQFLALLALLLANSAQAAQTADLGEITVTGTREEALKAETSATVDMVGEEEIQKVRPAHPAEIASRIPGVHINVTNGEGHQTAIRQPISTSPVYLYLEDGIPTRSTGFFNHNALFEINVPQAGGMEISKGPGTSLYGSDAIGGIINVVTRPAPEKPETEVNVEAGGHGWKRVLMSTGTSTESDGIRADVNITDTDGWRDATNYERQSATVRWDHFADSGATLKTVLAASNVNQQTAGSATITETDYRHNPTANYTPMSYRDVKAVRLSVAYEKEDANSLLSLTPYARHNFMDYMANWALSYDPRTTETTINSFGLLAKYRMDFKPYRTRVIVGADLDYSPGETEDYRLNRTKVGNYYTSTSVHSKIYDFDATYMGISPYIHTEFSPTEQLRINAGLRYDHMEYDYDNNMADGTFIGHFGKTYYRPADTTETFDHLSPKLGLTYAFSDRLNGFASYKQAFRAPSAGQLFNAGRTENSTDLDPVRVHSYETGVRGSYGKDFNYELSVYYMKKKDDILRYEHPDGTRENMNAGETLHKGIEIGLNAQLMKDLTLGASYSYAKHTYEKWEPNNTTDYSGNEMPNAPRHVANTRLDWTPPMLNGGQLELEWIHLGDYYTNDQNTGEYDGHNLFNLRGSYFASKQFEIYGRVMNLMDRTYADRAKGAEGAQEFAPGLPRTVYVGVNYTFD